MSIKCCKDCVPPTRYPGCHSECEEYIKQKKEMQMVNEKIREYNKGKHLGKYAFLGDEGVWKNHKRK